MSNQLSPVEKATLDMVNLLKVKEIEGVITTGSTKSGTFTQYFQTPIKLNPNAAHKIYLQSFSGWSNIPNIKTGINDNFTYINGTGNVRSMTIPEGSYQLSDIYTYIQGQMFNNGDFINTTNPVSYSINFSTFLPTQQVQILLSNNFQVDLRPNNSVGSLLGFNKVLLTTSQSSTNLVNVLPTQSINIKCDIANGFIINGKISNILYSFNNSIPRGYMINIVPNPIVPCLCNMKLINSITISFTDENDNLINFNGEQFIVRLVIEQF